jgi:ATP-dependent Clp protease adapter protein ClpS
MVKDTKSINVEIKIEHWKRLKIMSIEKNITLQEVVNEILERFVYKKAKSITHNEEQ